MRSVEAQKLTLASFELFSRVIGTQMVENVKPNNADEQYDFWRQEYLTGLGARVKSMDLRTMMFSKGFQHGDTGFCPLPSWLSGLQ